MRRLGHVLTPDQTPTTPPAPTTLVPLAEGRDPVRERDRLRRAIVEHRTAVNNAGAVRVDDRDVPIAKAKHAADKRLWSEVK